MKLVVVTGLSGAGKSQALRALEDMGFYCVDNLPPMLIPNMARLCMEPISRRARQKLREKGVPQELWDEALDELLAMNIHYDIIYLNASDEELIRRYKETRRAHPMGGDKMLIQNIQKERLLLKDLEKRATRIIDTTTMLTRQLRETLLRLYGEGDVDKAIAVNVLSFGFKHGLPQDADLVFDVRFIPNPFYIPEMRPLTGADAPVHDYVMSFEETRVFLNKTLDLLKFLIPHYVSEGKDRLVIAVGCTGGQHRSVCLTNEIAKGLKAAGFHATASHRDTQIETKEK